MNIPGYELRREIGHGRKARVYLARQLDMDRDVAVKVVEQAGEEPSAQGSARGRPSQEEPSASGRGSSASAELPTRPQGRASGRGRPSQEELANRLLREADVLRRLRHPNIVSVYDAGVHEGVAFVVMEYLAGGNLQRRLQEGVSLAEVRGIVRDIAAALDHAHGNDVLHCDVKPENILFRDAPGAGARSPALLSDFGIARIASETSSADDLTQASVPYASPEQLAGRQLDHRADLYGLGAVLHLMLAGEPPPRADTDGIVRLHEATPRLPRHFAPFADAMGRVLAPLPEARPASAAEFVRELDAVVVEGAPNVVVRAAAVTTAEIQSVAPIGDGPDPLVTRAEPWRKRRRRRRWLAAVLGVALVVGATAVLRPEWPARAVAFMGLAEDPDIAVAWNDAEALGADPNQSLGAVVAAYRRVLELDPSNADAAAAIDDAADRWKQDVQAAIEADDLALASMRLDDVAAVFPNDVDISSLFNRLRNRRHAEQLINDTQRLLERAGLSHEPSATAAIQAYQEALRLSPGDPIALAALDALAEHYTGLARDAAIAGDVADAMNNLGRAVTANPDFAGLGDVRATINAAATLQAQMEAMLQQAADLRERGALIDPPASNAAQIYHQVLATDPANAVAMQGLAEVSAQVLTVFVAELEAGRQQEARRLIDRSVASGLDDGAVNDMKGRLEQEIARLEQVAGLLAEARTLFAEGYITEPVEANAVARLREATRLDPGNAEAQQLLATCAERLAAAAEDAHAAGMAEEARRYLDLALTVTPGVQAWRERRDAWIADGGE